KVNLVEASFSGADLSGAYVREAYSGEENFGKAYHSFGLDKLEKSTRLFVVIAVVTLVAYAFYILIRKILTRNILSFLTKPSPLNAFLYLVFIVGVIFLIF
ncbi:hypothetical protein OAT39_02720, partial [Candidatus Thioglobus sp.]|nr:hypothetical protein [Candidatus Thioglobus sp.]